MKILAWAFVAALAVTPLVFWSITKPAPTSLSEEQRRVLVQKIRAEFINGSVLYNLGPADEPIPVAFEVTDAVNAAETWCIDRAVGVNINDRMAAQHWRRFTRETIPHEVAHMLLCRLGRPDWNQHGIEWATIVREQGAVPKPYHNYEVPQ